MAKKLFIGNLSFQATEEGLRTLFSQYGEVQTVTIVTDRYTGNPRGFGFIEMENADEAIAQLNDKEYEGRQMKVSEARERPPRQHGGGGGGGNFRREGGGGGGFHRGGRGGGRDGGGYGRERRNEW